MDWQALIVSLELGFMTSLVLAPVALILAYFLAFGQFAGRRLAEAFVLMPLVLPPTVLGFYLLAAFSPQSTLGALWRQIFGTSLAFSFEGLVAASVVANLPFAVQPLQRAFEAIPQDIRDAASVGGMAPLRRFLRIDLPLAWPGLLTGVILTFAHTLGEFGVVLMVGGSIEGETRTLAISIYDATQSFDNQGAGVMAAVLVMVSLGSVLAVMTLGRRARF